MRGGLVVIPNRQYLGHAQGKRYELIGIRLGNLSQLLKITVSGMYRERLLDVMKEYDAGPVVVILHSTKLTLLFEKKEW